MSWYSVRVIYRSLVNGAPVKEALLEESIRVFTASTDDEAVSKREVVARDGEHSYKNENGDTIQWIVDSVDAAQDIFEEQLLDGTEVHSRLFREG